jgi:hypothetical protein
VLVDIRLGDESRFDLARRLSSTVILVSTHAQSEYAEEIAASNAVARSTCTCAERATTDYGLP